MSSDVTGEQLVETGAVVGAAREETEAPRELGEAPGEEAVAEQAALGQLGVLATWRETSSQARALLIGVFVNKLAAFMQIFLVLFLTHRGFSPSRAGFALGMYGGGAVIGTMIGGAVSDRLSARMATMISMFSSAGLLVSIIYLQNYYVILVAVVLVSLTGQFYRPAAQAGIVELTPPERLVMVTAMYRLSLNLGTTAAPLLGVALVSVSYNLLFWGEASAALAYGIAAMWMLPRVPRTAPAAQAVTEEAVKDGRSGYLALLSDRRYMIFLFAFLLLNLAYHQYTGPLPLAIVKAGMSVWWYAAVISFNAAVVVLLEVWVTRYVQAWPMRVAQMCGFVLLAIAYGVYAIKMAPVFLIIGTLMWTLSEVIGAPTMYAYPGMIAPAHLRGRYFGAMQSTYGLGSTIGPIVGVLLYVHVGQLLFLWAAVVAVAAIIVGQIGLRRPDAVTPAAEPSAV